MRGDLLFRVVAVPGGEHDVEFRFEPTSVKLGLAVSLIAVLVAVGALVISSGSVRRRRTT
jgi:uncharacterized membrane protein YfhO